MSFVICNNKLVKVSSGGQTSIDWNGDIAGRDQTGLEDWGILAYKVSENMPLASSLVGGNVSYSGMLSNTFTIKSHEQAKENDSFTCAFEDFAALCGLLVKSGDTSKIWCVNIPVLGASMTLYVFVATEAQTLILYEDGYPEDEYQFVVPSTGMFLGSIGESPESVYVSNLTYGGGGGSSKFVVCNSTAPTKVGPKPSYSAINKTFSDAGTTQTNGYTTPAHVTMTGQNHGLNVGQYVASYTPDSGYTWDDDTTDTCTITLTIQRKNSARLDDNCEIWYSSAPQVGAVHEHVDIDNQYYKTDVGIYQCVGTPDSNHCWFDGTYGSKTVTWTMKQWPITVTAGSATRQYNSYPLTLDQVSITTGYTMPNDTAVLHASGTITEVGSTNNVPSIQITRGGSSVAGNYAITYVNGTLTIEPASELVITPGGTATGTQLTTYTEQEKSVLTQQMIDAGLYTAQEAASASILSITGTTTGTVNLYVGAVAQAGNQIKIVHKKSNNTWETLYNSVVPDSLIVQVTLTEFSPIAGSQLAQGEQFVVQHMSDKSSELEPYGETDTFYFTFSGGTPKYLSINGTQWEEIPLDDGVEIQLAIDLVESEDKEWPCYQESSISLCGSMNEYGEDVWCCIETHMAGEDWQSDATAEGYDIETARNFQPPAGYGPYRATSTYAGPVYFKTEDGRIASDNINIRVTCNVDFYAYDSIEFDEPEPPEEYELSSTLQYVTSDSEISGTITNEDDLYYTITPDEGYILPTDITVTGECDYSWNEDEEGTLNIWNAQSDISITITGEPEE